MTPELELPGFRFHPTEDELLNFYLKNIVSGKKSHFDIIGFLNIYHHEPWELPGLSKIGEREWYFFVPRDRKHGSGGRPNRTTEHGFWKATGSDRKIVSLSEPKRVIGMKKTLVFYRGRAPKGNKTDWVMNEYRLPDGCPLPKEIVLCKIYRKATSLKVLEQRAAMEEAQTTINTISFTTPSPPPSLTFDNGSFCCQQPGELLMAPMSVPNMMLKQEEHEEEVSNSMVQENIMEEEVEEKTTTTGTSLQLPPGKINLPELQVPKANMDWSQDPIWCQLSPWLQNIAQNLTPYAAILN